MEVVQVFARLKHNGIILDRNIYYQIKKYLLGFNEMATFRIQKDYYKANEITIAKDDKIIFQLSTDGGSYIDVFNGVSTAVKESERFFIIEAENNVSLKESFQETFEDTSLSEILSKLTNYELKINNIDFKKIILDATKKECIFNILQTAKEYLGSNIYYFYEDGKIIITEELSGKNYIVDDYTIIKNGSHITIFPIPELTLKDILTYKDVSYNLKSLIFENNKIHCEVFAA